MTDFGYETELDVRFRDLDTQNHVNSSVYATYCEQARIDYLNDVVGLSLREITIVLARLELDYVAPVTDAETVTVGVSATELGTSSFRLAYELHADGAVVARAETVQVAYDPETGETSPVPEEWRRRIEEHEGFDGERS